MNKKFTIIMFFSLLILVACSSDEETSVLKDGNYVLEQKGDEEVLSPHVTISEDSMLFSYDSLSSYLLYGNYTIDEDILIMTTYDKKYSYVFQIDGDKLIFQEKESSSVSLIDSRFGGKITDKAEFKRKDE